MPNKKFHVNTHYIQVDHPQQWYKIKKKLNLPIWAHFFQPRIKPEPLEKMKLMKEAKRVRTNYRVFLRAMGDLRCELEAKYVTFSSIKAKFLELSRIEYDSFANSIDEEPESEEKKMRIKKIIKETRDKHLDKAASNMMNKKKNIDSINKWLDEKIPALFIKKGEREFKLLIYFMQGTEGDKEYFCSKKNLKSYKRIIKRIEKGKTQFEDKIKRKYIKPLEKELKPPSKKKIEYFRKLGPLEKHFQRGWMFHRPQVDKIIEELEKCDGNNVQLLEGDSASGKTVIARNIGYDLKKKGWKTYTIAIDDFKDKRKRKLIEKGLEYLEENANSVFVLIEDVHKESRFFVPLLESLIKNDLKTRFLLTTRGSYKVDLTRAQLDIFERCEKEDLDEVDFPSLTNDIIKVYKENQDCQRRNAFEKNFTSEHRDKIIVKAKRNLWILAYFLDAWNPNKGVDMDIVYDKVKKDIDDLDREFKNKYKDKYKHYGVVDALLTLAPFSHLEVPVPGLFFDKICSDLKFDSFTLEKLSEYGEIQFKDGFYSVPHSLLAQLYMETVLYKKDLKYYSLLNNINNHPMITERTKENTRYPLNLVHTYFQTRPINFGEFFLKLAYLDGKLVNESERAIWPYVRLKKSGNKYNIISELLKNKKTSNSLKQSLLDSGDLSMINRVLELDYWKSNKNEIHKLFDWVVNEKWIEKLEHANIEDINRFINTAYTDFLSIDEEHRFLNPLFNNLESSILISKLQKTSIDELGFFIILISRIDERLLTNYKEVIIQKINNMDTKKIKIIRKFYDLIIVLHITKSGVKIYQDIKKDINLNKMLSLFEDEFSALEIRYLLPVFMKDFLMHEEYAEKIIEIITSKISKYNLEKQPRICLQLLGLVAGFIDEKNKDLLIKLINNIDVTLLKSSIDQPDFDGICYLWGVFKIIPIFNNINVSIGSVNKKGIKLLVDQLNLWEFFKDDDLKYFHNFLGGN